MVDLTKQCGAKLPRRGEPGSWVCTLAPGHAGNHVCAADTVRGTKWVLAVWRATS